MNFTEEELLSALAGFLWPLFRIGAMLIAMPVFSARAVPPKSKLIISIVITLVIWPVLPKMLVIEIFSFQTTTMFLFFTTSTLAL